MGEAGSPPAPGTNPELASQARERRASRAIDIPFAFDSAFPPGLVGGRGLDRNQPAWQSDGGSQFRDANSIRQDRKFEEARLASHNSANLQK